MRRKPLKKWSLQWLAEGVDSRGGPKGRLWRVPNFVEGGARAILLDSRKGSVYSDSMNTSAWPIHFQFPELFLLAIPVWFAYRKWGRADGATGVVRLVVLGLLVVALTGPELDLGGRGVDVVVVVDRSRSMPGESAGRIQELIVNLEKGRRAGDKVGLVTFGTQAAIEQILSHEAAFDKYNKEILPDGSDLNDALQTALNLTQSVRPARILVFSDGESNGPTPLSAARRAREMGVPIDYRSFERLRTGDVAVDSVLLPETVSPREPFQYSVWVQADREADGTVAVYRDGESISRREVHFKLGANQFHFRDLLEQGGLYNYEVRLEAGQDPVLENNRGAGVVRVDAGPRLLVLNSDGKADNLVRALEAARIPLDVAAAGEHPVSQDALDRYRAVIVENVPASEFGRIKMERLAQFVEELGGGLMLTGGERSFGNGGYFKSPLDEVLPVSMEMREEHRKTRLALAIALDRSGSMTAPVKGGKTKMDLADLGTAECVRLLSPGDSVAVIAVDSSAHVIQALTPVDDPEPIARKTLKIQSEGGGIFVYEALVAAGNQLMKAEQSTKHIILFSDAADSEEPGAYKSLLAKYEAAGITTSVIGLGTKADPDAKLLEDVAALGKGNIMFTADAEELPRLFAEDTMSVARSSFIKKDEMTEPQGIAGQLLSDARLMGEYAAGGFPRVDGYNLSYLKPRATMGVVSQDEFAAPWSAFWYRGLGRVAALTVEADGQYSGDFGRWPGYGEFLITHARWLLGGDDPDQAYLAVRREGQDAVVTLELDPERSAKQQVEAPTLNVVLPGVERTKPLQVPFEWQGADTLTARFRLAQTGTYRPLVQLGARQFVRGPAITLPYSPEYMPRAGLPTGREVLKSLAELTEGKERVNPLETFGDPPRSTETWSLLPMLVVTALALLLLEIAGRRLSLWDRLVEAVPTGPASAGSVPSQRLAWKRAPAVATSTSATSARPAPASAPPRPVEPAAPPALDVFEQAKLRAKRRQ